MFSTEASRLTSYVPRIIFASFFRDDLPLYSFSDTTPDYQNVLRVDVLSEFQEFTESTQPPQSDAMTQATPQVLSVRGYESLTQFDLPFSLYKYYIFSSCFAGTYLTTQ